MRCCNLLSSACPYKMPRHGSGGTSCHVDVAVPCSPHTKIFVNRIVAAAMNRDVLNSHLRFQSINQFQSEIFDIKIDKKNNI